jgi:hypothetical protein
MAEGVVVAKMFDQCREMFERVLAVYRKAGCACGFPRFAQIVGFDFRDYGAGPVGCHLTETGIALVMAETGTMRQLRGEGRSAAQANVYRFQCRMCGTEAEYIDDEFSVNMRAARLKYGAVKAKRLGAAALARAPMPKGFFGFRAEDIEKCARGFMVEGTFADLERYLTELADVRPRASAECPLANRDQQRAREGRPGGRG